MKCVKGIRIKGESINTSFPISGVIVFGSVLIVHRVCRLPNRKTQIATRRKIAAINRRSLSRLLFKVIASRIKFTSLLTLTYGQNYPINGKQCKADVNQMLIYLKRSFPKFSYFWFLEFQVRGAPHIHLISTLPPPSPCERELVAELWSNIAEAGNWPYTAIETPYRKRDAFFGMWTRDSVFRQHRRVETWEGIRREDGAIRYALKYASKMYQKRVPRDYRDVGRFWATSRDVAPPKGTEIPLNETELREVLKASGRDFDKWEVLPKFIFIN